MPVPEGAARPEEDPLARLRERVQAAQEAAERLIVEARAAAEAEGGATPPGSGAAGRSSRSGASGPGGGSGGGAAGGAGDEPPGGDRPPPRGWELPSASATGGATADAAQAFAALVDAVRAAVPRELAQQLAEFVRELLLALRALIDWCLERLQARREAALEVEEIPID